jgi:hypothetical protein
MRADPMHHTNTVRRFIIAGGRRHFMPEKNPIHFTNDRGSRETWGIVLDRRSPIRKLYGNALREITSVCARWLTA